MNSIAGRKQNLLKTQFIYMDFRFLTMHLMLESSSCPILITATWEADLHPKELPLTISQPGSRPMGWALIYVDWWPFVTLSSRLWPFETSKWMKSNRTGTPAQWSRDRARRKYSVKKENVLLRIICQVFKYSDTFHNQCIPSTCDECSANKWECFPCI